VHYNSYNHVLFIPTVIFNAQHYLTVFTSGCRRLVDLSIQLTFLFTVLYFIILDVFIIMPLIASL